MKSMSLLYGYMGKKQFRSECRGGHFKIQGGWLHTLKYVICIYFIGFLDPENMGIATKSKFL